MHHSRSHTQETQHAISTEIKHPEDYPIAQRETLTSTPQIRYHWCAHPRGTFAFRSDQIFYPLTFIM